MISYDYDIKLYTCIFCFQNYEESQETLVQTLTSCVDETERRELKENIEFYSANIDGLTQEIKQLTGTVLSFLQNK
jgi:hypothetical protein